jgi:hypothetical protein
MPDTQLFGGLARLRDRAFRPNAPTTLKVHATAALSAGPQPW